MSEELDVFASAVTKSAAPKPQQPQQQQGSGGNNGQKKRFHNRGGKNFNRGPKPNNSPIRGANGEESVNPLLNAPLPTEQRVQEVDVPANPNRNPDLPEYRLADIQTWTAPEIVERMMPGADPEELGTYRKHELIFAAIRRYLAKPPAALRSSAKDMASSAPRKTTSSRIQRMSSLRSSRFAATRSGRAI